MNARTILYAVFHLRCKFFLAACVLLGRCKKRADSGLHTLEFVAVGVVTLVLRGKEVAQPSQQIVKALILKLRLLTRLVRDDGNLSPQHAFKRMLKRRNKPCCRAIDYRVP